MTSKFIAIEGNIGAGKTTLATKLAHDLKARLILEQFSKNPFLEKFYKFPDKQALALELFFMAERYNQLKSFPKDMFQPLIISDYIFMKSFAQNNLKLDELQLFNRLFDIMYSSIQKPDLIIFLYSHIKRLKENILERGRGYESNISTKYLLDIQAVYLDYFKKQDLYPVVILRALQCFNLGIYFMVLCNRSLRNSLLVHTQRY